VTLSNEGTEPGTLTVFDQVRFCALSGGPLEGCNVEEEARKDGRHT